MQNTKSWFNGNCKLCNFNVVVTQPDIENNPTDDYCWYCSNIKCIKHIPEHTGDVKKPDWVVTEFPSCLDEDNYWKDTYYDVYCEETGDIYGSPDDAKGTKEKLKRLREEFPDKTFKSILAD